MAIKSKKKLNEMFEFNFQLQNLKEGDDYFINYEAFGRKVIAFIYVMNDKNRNMVAKVLGKHDFKVEAVQHGRVEVQLSFFKAYGWNA